MADVYFEELPGQLAKIGDRWLRDVSVVVPDEWIKQIAQGYRCLQCFQSFDHAWPELCTLPGCGYPVKEEQRREFDRCFQGQVEQYTLDLGP